jgi:hypothetical protein
MLGSSRVAAQLAASQEGLSSMSELVSDFHVISLLISYSLFPYSDASSVNQITDMKSLFRTSVTVYETR